LSAICLGQGMKFRLARVMKEFWDKRFQTSEYIYGLEPNVYFKRFINTIKKGHLLLPAEGEGRNAVFAARHKWKVDAFDISVVAREKALDLAEKHRVCINYSIADIDTFSYHKLRYDAVALIYVHQSRPAFQKLIASIHRCLKIGGILVFEAFSKEQINYQSGGPRDLDMLYDITGLIYDLEGFRVLEVEQRVTMLDEGPVHQGPASIIRLKACKI